MTTKREDSLLDEISRLKAENRQLQSSANGSQLVLSYLIKRYPKQEVRIPVKEILAEDGFVERDWDDITGIVTYRIPKRERVR